MGIARVDHVARAIYCTCTIFFPTRTELYSVLPTSSYSLSIRYSPTVVVFGEVSCKEVLHKCTETRIDTFKKISFFAKLTFDAKNAKLSAIKVQRIFRLILISYLAYTSLLTQNKSSESVSFEPSAWI